MLFHPSSLGLLMTKPRSKSEDISETAKSYLIELWVENKYGRVKNIENKYMAKGTMVEQESIDLYNLFGFTDYKKNEKTISNEYLVGTPDIYEGKSLDKATLIIDIKSSWDIFTFTKARMSDLNANYYWQLQGYMALTGSEKSKLVYCLVNTPESLIDQEVRSQLYKTGATGQAAMMLQEDVYKLSKYEDIPYEDRVFEIDVEREDEQIELIYKKIELCRKWIKENL